MNDFIKQYNEKTYTAKELEEILRKVVELNEQ